MRKIGSKKKDNFNKLMSFISQVKENAISNDKSDKGLAANKVFSTSKN